MNVSRSNHDVTFEGFRASASDHRSRRTFILKMVAAPFFILGASIQGELFGDRTNLDALEKGNFKFTADFCSVYRTVLADCLGGSSEIIIQQAKYVRLPVPTTKG